MHCGTQFIVHDAICVRFQTKMMIDCSSFSLGFFGANEYRRVAAIAPRFKPVAVRANLVITAPSGGVIIYMNLDLLRRNAQDPGATADSASIFYINVAVLRPQIVTSPEQRSRRNCAHGNRRALMYRPLPHRSIKKWTVIKITLLLKNRFDISDVDLSRSIFLGYLPVQDCRMLSSLGNWGTKIKVTSAGAEYAVSRIVHSESMSYPLAYSLTYAFGTGWIA
jgi:hypothetical protein